jgi:hypothetical protein
MRLSSNSDSLFGNGSRITSRATPNDPAIKPDYGSAYGFVGPDRCCTSPLDAAGWRCYS